MPQQYTADANRKINDGVTSTKEVAPYVKNTYHQKKNIAQGMFDIALMSTNANQLRYVLDSPSHPYYYFSVTIISFSITLQVLVFIILLLNTKGWKTCKAMLNDLLLIGAALIIVTNLFIAPFSPHGAQ